MCADTLEVDKWFICSKSVRAYELPFIKAMAFWGKKKNKVITNMKNKKRKEKKKSISYFTL